MAGDSGMVLKGLKFAKSAFEKASQEEGSAPGKDEASASSGAGAGDGRTFFDGSKRLFDAILLPAAVLEPGRRASGLAPPTAKDSSSELPRGLRPLETYRQPRAVRVRESVYAAVASILLPASLIAPFLGLGLVGGGILAAASFTAAAAWEIGGVDRDPPEAAEGIIGRLERPDARTERRVRRVLRVLVRRLGLPMERVPRRILLFADAPMNASASGSRLDQGAVIRVGESYGRLPIRMAAAVLAHELGHLVHGDNDGLRHLVREESVAGYATAFFFMAFMVLCAGVGLGAFNTVSLPFIMFAPVLFAIGRACAFASLRQMETRADDFSAWLTDPIWLAEFLADFADDAFDQIFASHPSPMSRVERLLQVDIAPARKRASSGIK